MKIAGGNESGPGWQLTFVFPSNRAISFGRKDTEENVSEVRHGGHEFKRSLSVVRVDVNCLQTSSAIF